MRITFILSFFLSLSLMVSSQPKMEKSKLIQKGALLKLISSEFKFTEGPTADRDGNVFFTDQPNDRIMKWSTNGTISVFMEGAGRSNGLAFDMNGNLLACADLHNELWSIDKNRKVTILVKNFKGKKLNGPNDLWIHPRGWIYFTDPFYKRDYWNRSEKEIEQENVYYFSADGKILEVAAGDFVRPNGIVGTRDGKKLYVADINAGKTYSFRIGNDGSLSDRKLFAALGSDGITIDKKGNVYLTGKGVTILNPDGEQIGHIPVPEGWTANVCFGGSDKKTLFITASKSLYSLQMKVNGQ
ncbi:MAG: SMP-30/gluconolactonase/LRE family protein [Cyclobacteriaceae bacterium]